MHSHYMFVFDKTRFSITHENEQILQKTAHFENIPLLMDFFRSKGFADDVHFSIKYLIPLRIILCVVDGPRHSLFIHIKEVLTSK